MEIAASLAPFARLGFGNPAASAPVRLVRMTPVPDESRPGPAPRPEALPRPGASPESERGEPGAEGPDAVAGQAPPPGPVAADPEGELLRRHVDGDPDAFAELVRLYRAPVWSYLHRTGVADSEREDLFQDIFVKVHRAARRYDPARPLHPWLFTIVANTVRSHQRQGRIQRLVFSREEPPLAVLGRPATSPRRAEAREALSRVERELRELPDVQRQVVLLASVEKLKMREIAEALEIPEGTVKTLLRRARSRLAARIARKEGDR